MPVLLVTNCFVCAVKKQQSEHIEHGSSPLLEIAGSFRQQPMIPLPEQAPSPSSAGMGDDLALAQRLQQEEQDMLYALNLWESMLDEWTSDIAMQLYAETDELVDRLRSTSIHSEAETPVPVQGDSDNDGGINSQFEIESANVLESEQITCYVCTDIIEHGKRVIFPGADHDPEMNAHCACEAENVATQLQEG
ncbi:hypothetical protein HDU83_008952, partial [Entophlyctis luteolus]